MLLPCITEERAVFQIENKKQNNTQYDTSVSKDITFALESEIPPPPDIGQNDTDVSEDAFALQLERTPPDQRAAIVKEAVPTEPMKLTKKVRPYYMFLKFKANRGGSFLKQIVMEWYGIRISFGS